MDVEKECIVPGNGSSELIRLFAEAALEEGSTGSDTNSYLWRI